MNHMFKAECAALLASHGTSIDAVLLKMIRMPRSTTLEFADKTTGLPYEFRCAGISVNFELWARNSNRGWTEIGFYSDH